MSLTCQLLKMFVAMKLTVFLLCIFSLTGYSMSYSQGISLDIKDKPIEYVFDLIEKQTDYTFFYKYNDLQKSRKVSIAVKGATIEEALKQALANQPFQYTIRNKTIIVSVKDGGTKSESVTGVNAVLIRGKVVDTEGNPLPGVSVIIKGTSSGTITDDAGDFAIDVRNVKGTLVFSLIGYETRELTLNNEQNIVVTLGRSDTELDQIVVVGYGTQKK